MVPLFCLIIIFKEKCFFRICVSLCYHHHETNYLINYRAVESNIRAMRTIALIVVTPCKKQYVGQITIVVHWLGHM